MTSGVYKILNLVTNKFYIGSTTGTFDKRFREHINALKRGNHPNSYLQNSWNKYGQENFKFLILEKCFPENCIEKEEWWLQNTRCFNSDIGYNLCPHAGNTFGKEMSQTQKNNISKALAGKLSGDKHPMWGTKRNPTMLGKKHSEEVIDKMKKFQNNRIRSKEELEKFKILCESQVGTNHPRYGVKLTGEELERVRNLRKGIPSENKKGVIKYDLEMNFLEEYVSVSDAAKANGVWGAAICKICKGQRKTLKRKFIFRYKLDNALI